MNSLKSLQHDAMKALSLLLAPGTRVALLDFPRHQNAGDSFIWLGTLAYLAELGVSVDYVADVHCFTPSDLRRRLPEGPILITGGGNFGDRWQEHQNFREMIVTTFPDRKIIQLPQSLDFETDDGLEKAKHTLNSHADLTIMLRQTVDMERAERWFPSAHRMFCPDLALGLGHLSTLAPAEHDAVLLLREDSESVTGRDLGAFAGIDYEVTDWNINRTGQYLWHLYRTPENIARVLPFSRPMLLNAIKWSYEKAAYLNLTGGRKTISRGKILVTDRLHGMFLGALMGIPTIAMDNANGKVAGIYQDYMHGFPHVQMANSLDEAASLVSGLLSTSSSRL